METGKKPLDKEQLNKKSDTVGKWTAFLALAEIVVFAVLFFALPKKTFSDNENRTLAKAPAFSTKALQSGEFTQGLEDYVTDHFPMRDFWVALKSETQILLGNRSVNGIWICADHYLIGDYPEPENTERITEIFRKFHETILTKNPSLKVELMLVPTAVTIYRDKLPKGANPASQTETIEQISQGAEIPFVDVYETLKEHAGEGLFYHTDHHWTTLGAYYGYLEYCRAAGFEAQGLEEFQVQTVTTDFEGTYASKVNLWGQKADAIVTYTNENDALCVHYTDTEEISDSLYNLDYVKEKDKYSLFLNNLHPLIEITNENAETNRELLLVKDSYANSMVPFLTHHFHKIYVVDTRYYIYGPSSLIEEHPEITDVLMLYNLSTIDTDTGIRAIF